MSPGKRKFLDKAAPNPGNYSTIIKFYMSRHSRRRASSQAATSSCARAGGAPCSGSDVGGEFAEKESRESLLSSAGILLCYAGFEADLQVVF